VVFTLTDFAGERMARLRDPFGHLWIVRERVEELSVEEIQRRRDFLFENGKRCLRRGAGALHDCVGDREHPQQTSSIHIIE